MPYVRDLLAPAASLLALATATTSCNRGHSQETRAFWEQAVHVARMNDEAAESRLRAVEVRCAHAEGTPPCVADLAKVRTERETYRKGLEDVRKQMPAP